MEPALKDFKKPGGKAQCFTTSLHSLCCQSALGAFFWPVVFFFCNLKRGPFKTMSLITLFDRVPAKELYLLPGATLEPVTIAFGISL